MRRSDWPEWESVPLPDLSTLEFLAERRLWAWETFGHDGPIQQRMPFDVWLKNKYSKSNKAPKYRVIYDELFDEYIKIDMAKIPHFDAKTKEEQMLRLIQHYIDVFSELPSGSHMVRAYTHMEKLFLEKYNQAKINPSEKDIEKFDKLKSLALNNENINERKLAFFRSVQLYMRMTEIKDLEIPQNA